MWPARQWTPGKGAHNKNPLCQDSNTDGIEENPQILEYPTSTLGSVLQAPRNSTEDSIYFSELMTKPEEIIESPGAQEWDSIFNGLSNLQSVKIANPSTRFQSEANSSTSTSLTQSNLAPPLRNSSSKNDKPHRNFFKEIITDSMTNSSVGNSQNL